MPWGDGTGPWWGESYRHGQHIGFRRRGFGYGPWWADDYHYRRPYESYYRQERRNPVEEEREYLENEAKRLQEELDYIKRRLEDLK